MKCDKELIKNATLAEIFAKELPFMNRTIQMTTLITSCYHEENEDEAIGSGIQQRTRQRQPRYKLW